MSGELVRQDRQEMAVATKSEPLSIAEVFKAVLATNISKENLEVAKQLLEMDAKQKFNTAFAALQAELPVIEGVRGIPDKQGNIKFRYANFEDLDDKVRPVCLKHGFTYSFREIANENGRTTVSMTLAHSGGHEREIPYSVRTGSGPPGASLEQADGSTHTYAKRGALESGLCLRVVGQRTDAKMEGGPITAEQAESIEKRVALLNIDKAKFLGWLQAKTYAEIASSKYDMADDELSKREKGSK